MRMRVATASDLRATFSPPAPRVPGQPCAGGAAQAGSCRAPNGCGASPPLRSDESEPAESTCVVHVESGTNDRMRNAVARELGWSAQIDQLLEHRDEDEQFVHH